MNAIDEDDFVVKVDCCGKNFDSFIQTNFPVFKLFIRFHSQFENEICVVFV